MSVLGAAQRFHDDPQAIAPSTVTRRPAPLCIGTRPVSPSNSSRQARHRWSWPGRLQQFTSHGVIETPIGETPFVWMPPTLPGGREFPLRHLDMDRGSLNDSLATDQHQRIGRLPPPQLNNPGSLNNVGRHLRHLLLRVGRRLELPHLITQCSQLMIKAIPGRPVVRIDLTPLLAKLPDMLLKELLLATPGLPSVVQDGRCEGNDAGEQHPTQCAGKCEPCRGAARGVGDDGHVSIIIPPGFCPPHAAPPSTPSLSATWRSDCDISKERGASVLTPVVQRRFLSCEPLLGPVDLGARLYPATCPSGCGCRWPDDAEARECGCAGPCCTAAWDPAPGIDWVIVGGESGPGARVMDMAWAADLVEQCQAAGVAVFVKQLGSVWARCQNADPKGGDWAYWPADLRIRQFPTAKEAACLPIGQGQQVFP